MGKVPDIVQLYSWACLQAAKKRVQTVSKRVYPDLHTARFRASDAVSSPEM